MKVQENMEDMANFNIPGQWASAVSSWQYVVEHCHETLLLPSWTHAKKCKRITSFFMSMIRAKKTSKSTFKKVKDYKQRGYIKY